MRLLALFCALGGLAMVCVFPPLGIGLLLLALVLAVLGRSRPVVRIEPPTDLHPTRRIPGEQSRVHGLLAALILLLTLCATAIYFNGPPTALLFNLRQASWWGSREPTAFLASTADYAGN